MRASAFGYGRSGLLLLASLLVAGGAAGADLTTAVASRANPSSDDAPIGRGLSVGLVLGMYTGLNGLSYLAWWRQSPTHPFEWERDGWLGEDSYAGGADKLGHVWATHLLTRGVAEVLEAGGWNARGSTYAGATLSLGTFYVIEMRDAFTTGFSRGDMAANLLGVGLGVLFREVPRLDALFDLRVQYFPSSAYFKRFGQQGFDVAEDYTGETFLFAWHLCSLPIIERSTGPLRFVDLVLGYNARNYLPLPEDPRVTQYQDRFVGVSLNLQRIVDELWQGRHPRLGKSGTPGHGVAHFASEFFNLPYTTLPLGTWRNVHRR